MKFFLKIQVFLIYYYDKMITIIVAKATISFLFQLVSLQVFSFLKQLQLSLSLFHLKKNYQSFSLHQHHHLRNPGLHMELLIIVRLVRQHRIQQNLTILVKHKSEDSQHNVIHHLKDVRTSQIKSATIIKLSSNTKLSPYTKGSTWKRYSTYFFGVAILILQVRNISRFSLFPPFVDWVFTLFVTFCLPIPFIILCLCCFYPSLINL